MSRPTVITNEQILEAARAVFLEEGYGAPTAKIAQRAGVSEGTLFKRFHTKERLFFAALQIEYPAPWHRLAGERVGQGDVRDNLVEIAHQLLLFLLNTVPRMVALMGSPAQGRHRLPMHELRRKDEQVLQGFLDEEVRLGRLRRCDTVRVTQIIQHSLGGQVMSEIVEGSQFSPEERRRVVTGMISVLWDGIAPLADR